MKQYFKAILRLITGMAIISSTVLVCADNDLMDESITYGQTLENVEILESSVSGVSGKWGWKDPSIRPKAGTATYEATFVPTILRTIIRCKQTFLLLLCKLLRRLRPRPQPQKLSMERSFLSQPWTAVSSKE